MSTTTHYLVPLPPPSKFFSIWFSSANICSLGRFWSYHKHIRFDNNAAKFTNETKRNLLRCVQSIGNETNMKWYYFFSEMISSCMAWANYDDHGECEFGRNDNHISNTHYVCEKCYNSKKQKMICQKCYLLIIKLTGKHSFSSLVPFSIKIITTIIMWM